MEPGDFNDRLNSLVRDAEREGLHPTHVMNALDAKRDELTADSWQSAFEREQ